MNGRYLVLAERIRQELAELDRVVSRAARYARLASVSSDPEPLIDAAALQLHAFYTGVERVFDNIARELDGSVPSGRRWHRELLTQMTLEVKGLRPAVIDSFTLRALEDYLGFRHVVRSAYPSQLRPERVAELAANLGSLFQRLHQQLSRFAEHLEQLAGVEPEDAGGR